MRRFAGGDFDEMRAKGRHHGTMPVDIFDTQDFPGVFRPEYLHKLALVCFRKTFADLEIRVADICRICTTAQSFEYGFGCCFWVSEKDMLKRNVELNWQDPDGNKVCKARTILSQLEAEL